MKQSKGEVWFIGAGPGDPELLTVKGRRLIRKADLVLYAGSLVPPAVIAQAKPGARVVDSAPLTLEESHKLILDATTQGLNAARVHTGDPSLYGAAREQMLLLERDGIRFSVVPGVTAACAAAAAAGVSFTVPGAGQSLIITRLAGRTPIPDREKLRALAAHGCSLAVYLSAGKEREMQEELAAALPGDTVVICAHAVGGPEENIVRTTVANLAAAAKDFTRRTVFLILPNQKDENTRSCLYDPNFSHGRRKAAGT